MNDLASIDEIEAVQKPYFATKTTFVLDGSLRNKKEGVDPLVYDILWENCISV